jgi:hypothetical protein
VRTSQLPSEGRKNDHRYTGSTRRWDPLYRQARARKRDSDADFKKRAPRQWCRVGSREAASLASVWSRVLWCASCCAVLEGAARGLRLQLQRPLGNQPVTQSLLATAAVLELVNHYLRRSNPNSRPDPKRVHSGPSKKLPRLRAPFCLIAIRSQASAISSGAARRDKSAQLVFPPRGDGQMDVAAMNRRREDGWRCPSQPNRRQNMKESER